MRSRGASFVVIILLPLVGCVGAGEASGLGELGDRETSPASETGSIVDETDPRAPPTNETSVVEDANPEPDALVEDAPPPPPPPPPPGPKGFWRIERPTDSARTWLVAPEGTRIWGLGVNTVMREVTCDGMRTYIRRAAPSVTANTEWARLSTGKSGAITVAKPYCFNSVGSFSDTNDFDDAGGDSWMIRATTTGGAGAPYGVVLYPTPRGDDRALRDEKGNVLESGISTTKIGDPFNPAFATDLDKLVAADVTPRKDDPRLQMYFVGNEIGIFDEGGKGDGGVRDYRRYLWSQCPAGSTLDAPKCAPHALGAYLRERYVSIAKLNTAWESSYADFDALLTSSKRPVPYVHDCTEKCRADLQMFVHDRLLRAWVKLTTSKIRTADPNHIVSTPRLALGNSSHFRFWTPASMSKPDVWIEEGKNPIGTDTATVKYNPFDLLARVGNEGFDVISINVYSGDAELERPWFTDGIHRMQNSSGLPIYVSEFGIRARIATWTNKGGAGSFVPTTDATDDQIQRGAYYRSQIEQFVSFKGIVGASWHAWSDRYLAADPAHQIDMGLMKCSAPGMTAGVRWDELDDRIASTNCSIMKTIEAKTGL